MYALLLALLTDGNPGKGGGEGHGKRREIARRRRTPVSRAVPAIAGRG
jgi:hypothetical protein